MGLLDGKIAVVTGASRGIGADIARRFAGEGATVALTARTTQSGQHCYTTKSYRKCLEILIFSRCFSIPILDTSQCAYTNVTNNR